MAGEEDEGGDGGMSSEILGVSVNVKCDACHGNGVVKGAFRFIDCDTCNGKGFTTANSSFADLKKTLESVKESP